ncbi:hypothetical protein RhiJN_05548 [Ceratobasidium sp. AG-Ba]|nr:hypothetical protein RhiJN_05548 [Ceratobasidium sp. AG-Ba]
MSHEIVNNPMVEVGNEEEGFVNIDELTTYPQPFNQQHRNDKSTKKFYTHWDYEKIEQEISQLPEQDTESRNKSVRKILRAINNLDAQDYWWDMCEPRPPNDESIAAKVLEQPATTDNTSGLSRSEQRREKWAQRQKKNEGKERATSERLKRRGRFINDMATMDRSILDAHQRIYTADGMYVERFEAEKFCKELEKPRSNGSHWSSTAVAKYLGYRIQPEGRISTMKDESFIIEDLNGIPIVINLVNAFSSENTQKYTDMILELSEKVKLSTKQADKNGRGSGYCIREGYYAGCINMAYAWVALLKKKSEQAPSAGIVNGTMKRYPAILPVKHVNPYM